jgi:hypothetical protein
LLYHAIPGVYPLELLSDGQELVTAQGSNVTHSISGPHTFDKVPLVERDQVAINGIAHLLGGVLTKTWQLAVNP